jgi:hypothetical protein
MLTAFFIYVIVETSALSRGRARGPGVLGWSASPELA